jgi:hypothetical protein
VVDSNDAYDARVRTPNRKFRLTIRGRRQVISVNFSELVLFVGLGAVVGFAGGLFAIGGARRMVSVSLPKDAIGAPAPLQQRGSAEGST